MRWWVAGGGGVRPVSRSFGCGRPSAPTSASSLPLPRLASSGRASPEARRPLRGGGGAFPSGSAVRFRSPPTPSPGGGRGPRVRAAGLCGGPLAPRGGRPVCLTRRSAFPGWCSCRPLSLRVPHGVGGGRRSPRGFVSLVWAWSPTGRSLRTVPPPPASRAPIGLLRGLTDSTCRVRWPEGAARRLVRCRRGLARLFRNLNPSAGRAASPWSSPRAPPGTQLSSPLRGEAGGSMTLAPPRLRGGAPGGSVVWLKKPPSL